MVLTGMTEVFEENFSRGTLFIANLTGLELKPDFCGVNSKTDLLSHGTAFSFSFRDYLS
jgi:hypothetical protein